MCSQYSDRYGLKDTLSNFFSAELLAPYQNMLDSFKIPSVGAKEFGTNLTLFNTTFSMTEEFVGVYRMHPLLPDKMNIAGQNFTLNELSFNDPRGMVTSTDGSNTTTKTLLKSLSQTPARTLSLRNYPYELYDLDIPGRSEKLNLAEIDLMRDRERNLPRYNDARRQLLLEPYTSLSDLTNDGDELELLMSVYSDIEQVDFMVGCLVDKERPDGFAFGIVPYHIFVVMATRRLLSDRFFQEGMTAENYSTWGLNYVKTQTFQSILERHFPELDGKIPANPFSNDWEW